MAPQEPLPPACFSFLRTASVERNPKMKGLKGKSYIVTGGSDGIGAAAVQLLADEGAMITIADVNVEMGRELADKISNAGGKAQFVKTDVSNPEDAKTMVAKAIETFGRLDGAFNNAGVPNKGRLLHEIEFSEFQRCIAVNLAGVFNCMKYEIQHFLKKGGGVIVNTSSTAGIVAVPATPEYTASKHGVSGLTRAAAVDYGKQNIRVNAIGPAATRTAMYAQFAETNPDFDAAVAAVHPIGRASMPSEQASAAVWLLSDDASFVTGAILPVDGGYVAI
jgi:NAD(P)-dependent dehydrogenase (short-subunit alcohol dehydrogenase family)